MARHEARYVYDDSVKRRIEALLIGSERVSNFVQRAVEERLTRLEARDERRRREDRMKDIEYVRGLVAEIINEG